MLVDVSRIECVSEWKWLIVSWLITNWLTSWRLLNWMCWFLDFFLWLLELLERFTAVSVSNKCFWANLLNSTFMIDYLESIIKMLFWTRNRFRLVFLSMQFMSRLTSIEQYAENRSKISKSQFQPRDPPLTPPIELIQPHWSTFYLNTTWTLPKCHFKLQDATYRSIEVLFQF